MGRGWLGCALVLAGCAGEVAEDDVAVRIVAPVHDEVVAGAEVLALVEVAGASLVEPVAWLGPRLPIPTLIPSAQAHFGSHRAGAHEGFLRVWVDDVEVDDVAVAAFALPALQPGWHALRVELRWPFGRPYRPGVEDEVVFYAE